MLGHIIQTFMGSMGTLGFSILFNIRGPRRLLVLTLGGGIGWATYLVCSAGYGLDPFYSLLWSTCLVAGLSELLARVLKAPVIMILVPMLIPLIPGGGLYNTMSRLVSGDYEGFMEKGQRLLQEAGGIALGIICVASLTSLLTGLCRRFRQYQKAHHPCT